MLVTIGLKGLRNNIYYIILNSHSYLNDAYSLLFPDAPELNCYVHSPIKKIWSNQLLQLQFPDRK